MNPKCTVESLDHLLYELGASQTLNDLTNCGNTVLMSHLENVMPFDASIVSYLVRAGVQQTDEDNFEPDVKVVVQHALIEDRLTLGRLLYAKNFLQPLKSKLGLIPKRIMQYIITEYTAILCYELSSSSSSQSSSSDGDTYWLVN